jgi:hypothetical protein
MTTEKRDHFVYRAYDSDGLLLYVGCTGRPGQRYKQHMAGDNCGLGWFDPFVTHWRVTGPLPKSVARAIEKWETQNHHPIFNGHSRGNCIPRMGSAGLILAYHAHHGLRYPIPRSGSPFIAPDEIVRIGS